MVELEPLIVHDKFIGIIKCIMMCVIKIYKIININITYYYQWNE